MRGYLFIGAWSFIALWGLFADKMGWDNLFWPWSDVAFYILIGVFGVLIYLKGREGHGSS